MPFRRALSVLFGFALCLTAALRADELTRLAGENVEKIEGEIVSITDKEIVMLKDAEKITTPVDKVLQLSLQAPPKLAPDARYIDVELTDGSLLHCTKLSIKGKQVNLVLLSDKAGRDMQVPLESISYWQRDAHSAAVQKAWKERFLGKKRSSDLIVVKRGENLLEGVEGTIGEGIDDGKKIEFKHSSGKLELAIDTLQGMVFVRKVDPNAPVTICRLYDMDHNLLMVSSVAKTETGFRVTTPSGAKFEYARDRVVRFDYSTDKVVSLSDDAFWKAGKVNVIQTTTLGLFEKPRLNKNLEGRSLQLAGKSYPQGLAVKAHTELEFTLNGDYREFRSLIGMDDEVGGEGPTVLKIEGDGKDLYTMTFTRKTEPKQVRINIKDVQRLKIIVTSEDFSDLGKHLDLADAKVSK